MCAICTALGKVLNTTFLLLPFQRTESYSSVTTGSFTSKLTLCYSKYSLWDSNLFCQVSLGNQRESSPSGLLIYLFIFRKANPSVFSVLRAAKHSELQNLPCVTEILTWLAELYVPETSWRKPETLIFFKDAVKNNCINPKCLWKLFCPPPFLSGKKMLFHLPRVGTIKTSVNSAFSLRSYT